MKVYLVFLESGGWGIVINKETRIYHNSNSANSYRWRKQKTSQGKWKIRKLTII